MSVLLLNGNALSIPLADNSVHMCVTSPPYWGLRDYGTATWQGGDSECDHNQQHPDGGQRADRSLPLGRGGLYRDTCGKCGAVRVDAQLGLEPTPELYVEHMVAVFREVRRVLRDDGTLFLNLGDSYNGSGGAGGDYNEGGLKEGQPRYEGTYVKSKRMERGSGRWGGGDRKVANLKPKDLIGIPWRVAFALQQPYEKPHCIKSEVERAWMAALVDGEGCISIRRHDSYSNGGDGRTPSQDGFVPFITIGNNDRELLDRCVEITGYGKVGIKDRPSVDKRGVNSRRTYYGWRLDGNKAMDIIRDIYPYLVAKRKQAIIAHNLDLSNKRGKELRGNGPLPASEQEKREYMKELINKCNQRDPVDLPSWMVEPKREVEPGWYLRSDCIWAKPNPMPESVTDRPTKAHEYIFMLSKRANYYYDADAVREPVSPNSDFERGNNWREQQGTPTPYGLASHKALGLGNGSRGDPSGRNRRTVWNIATVPYSGAHFATYPPALVEPCIKAGTSERGTCPQCGAPWERVATRELVNTDGWGMATKDHTRELQGSNAILRNGNGRAGDSRVTTTGWRPTCAHDLDPIPAIVLDPFAGSGTTLLVARQLGRNGIGLDLSLSYLREQARERLGLTALEEWMHGKKDGAVLTDLPLFGGGA